MTNDKAFYVLYGLLLLLTNCDLTHDEWESRVRDVAARMKEKAADVFMLLRLAICYSRVSPPLYESMKVLGINEVKQRLLLAMVDLAFR